MKKSDIEKFFFRLSKSNPEPKGELVHHSTFTLLAAVVLSAQATDAGVNRVTSGLFAAADNPKAMVNLGETAVRDLIKSIGLYKTKAKNLIALSQQLIDRHGGKVPNDREDLEALPGVGRKTANVVLNIAFEEPVIAVDTHVFRVANRTTLAPGKNPAAVEAQLVKVVPNTWKMRAHHWLILHGRYVCTARKPKCPECLVSDLCRFTDKTISK